MPDKFANVFWIPVVVVVSTLLVTQRFLAETEKRVSVLEEMTTKRLSVLEKMAEKRLSVLEAMLLKQNAHPRDIMNLHEYDAVAMLQTRIGSEASQNTMSKEVNRHGRATASSMAPPVASGYGKAQENQEASLVQTRNDLVNGARSSASVEAIGSPLSSIESRDSVYKHARLLNKFDVVSLAGDLQKTVSKMWHGFDLTVNEHKVLIEALHAIDGRRTQQFVVDPHPSKRIHVLGPPDSGTNLLVHSLQLNWGNLATQACTNPDMCDASLWKHSIGDANDLYDRMRRCGDKLCTTQLNTNMSNAVVIIMVRSPIAQLASWQKAPYSLKPCMNRAWSDMINPCWSNLSPSWHDEIEGSQEEVYSDMSLHFSSSVEIYNRYIEEYLELKKDGRIGDVILLPYEDLVLTPDVEMKRIADAMGWDTPDRLRILSKAAKQHGSSGDRDDALEHLRSRSWIDSIGSQNVPSLCSLFNTTALEAFAEGTHTSDPVPYFSDCESPIGGSMLSTVASLFQNPIGVAGF